VVQVPSLARGLLIAADGQHHHVGFPRDFDGFRDQPAVFAGSLEALRPDSTSQAA